MRDARRFDARPAFGAFYVHTRARGTALLKKWLSNFVHLTLSVTALPSFAAPISFRIGSGVLKATISRYNSFVDSGVDEDFGKPKPLYKIAKRRVGDAGAS